jgi:hypothetical protein
LTLEPNRSFDRLTNLLGLKAQIASSYWIVGFNWPL